MTKPLYFYNGTTFEQVGPTTPQSPIAYQTSAPTGPATGDLWIDSDGDVDTYNRQLTRYYFVATAAQTTITGTDANGLTLAYVAGSEQVYVNGALQVRGQDYTATNGTSVVLTAGLAVNDVVEIFAYTAFTVANAYTKSETDSLVGAAPGLKLLVPTSVAVGSGTATIGTSGTVTFSGASSLSLNDVFNTTYDNYKFILNGTISAGAAIYLRYRISGTDNSTASSYISQALYVDGTSPSGARVTSDKATIGDFATTFKNTIACEIFDPFLAVPTRLQSYNNWSYNNSTWQSYFGFHNQSTSYTGLTIYTSTGTFTGTVSVYGYKD